ncbi:hypothetical protein ACJA3J_05595 [Halobacillus sp. SY10]|uniref:hypothetical protein n=1 Tax=Halobacillus sp. SY10 TaxID=3381356 RepID=UPI0038792B7A
MADQNKEIAKELLMKMVEEKVLRFAKKSDEDLEVYNQRKVSELNNYYKEIYSVVSNPVKD